VIAWFVYYQTPAPIPNDGERIEGQIAVIEAKKKAELESMLASLSNDSLREMSKDATHLASGKAIYEAKCAACHGLDLAANLNGIPFPASPSTTLSGNTAANRSRSWPSSRTAPPISPKA